MNLRTVIRLGFSPSYPFHEELFYQPHNLSYAEVNLMRIDGTTSVFYRRSIHQRHKGLHRIGSLMGTAVSARLLEETLRQKENMARQEGTGGAGAGAADDPGIDSDGRRDG